MLIADLADEAKFNDSGEERTAVLEAVGQNVYCDSALKLVTSKTGGYQEVALDTMMSDRCYTDGSSNVVVKNKIKLTMKSVVDAWERDSVMDSEWRDELNVKVAAILNKVENGGSSEL